MRQRDQEDAKLQRAKEGKRERQRIERAAWVTGFFLINLTQRREDRSQNIHAPTICHPPSPPPPPPLLPRARGEEGEGSASMLTPGLEEGRGGAASQPGHLDERQRGRDWRRRGDQPGREGERGSNTSYSRDLSPEKELIGSGRVHSH